MKDSLCPLLIDDREVDLSEVDDDMLLEANAAFASYPAAFAYSRTAILVKEGRDLETTLRWRRLADSGQGGMVAVFTDEELAIAWATGKG